jgi:hypothetical protein
VVTVEYQLVTTRTCLVEWLTRSYWWQGFDELADIMLSNFKNVMQAKGSSQRVYGRFRP